MDGINILSDPVFRDRASPVSFAGPKRYAPPGVPFEDLPRIDAVMISHDHYDHLDGAAVKRLGNGPRYFVPLGLADWLGDRGITNVTELDWWENSTLDHFRFHAVPIQHFSSRSLFGFNKTLWTGWVIETKLGAVFFAGCTGYAPHFEEIGDRFGPIRISLIPIGAYRPRWFMGSMHVDPVEAVKIHKDLRSLQSIAMHWGTFKLSDEPMGEPPLYLRKALKEAGLREEDFIVMKFGETRAFEWSHPEEST
jgi:L-ascorbate metabolism protein UlaG (beta-lactamase superfamily)